MVFVTGCLNLLREPGQFSVTCRGVRGMAGQAQDGRRISSSKGIGSGLLWPEAEVAAEAAQVAAQARAQAGKGGSVTDAAICLISMPPGSCHTHYMHSNGSGACLCTTC